MAEINELISKVFMLSPETKKELAETYPSMTEDGKKEFLEYINAILKKQDEILTYIVTNNPDFSSELKAFNASIDRGNIQGIEKQFKEQDEIDLLALEKELSNV